MIRREDILSIEYLKKTEYTGSHQGMRYRLEGIAEGGEKRLRATVWPEPFNYWKTAGDKKISAVFPFGEEGIQEAVAWMNERLEKDREKWDQSWENWKDCHMGEKD